MGRQNLKGLSRRSSGAPTISGRGTEAEAHRKNGGSPPVQQQQRQIKVLIADLEGVFRLGLSRLLAAESDLGVVAQVDQASDLISRIRELQPDVVFVQAEMLAGDRGLSLAAVREASEAGKFMVTASLLSEEEALDFVKAGACGVILKTADPALFVKCVRKVMEGEVWLPKKQVARMAELFGDRQGSARPADTLTKREKLVISCLVQGLRNREIAQRLVITEQTVKNHLRSVYDKVGVSDRVELVLYALHQQLQLPRVDDQPLP